MTTESTPSVPSLRYPEVARIIGISISTLQKLVREGSFPQPVRLSERTCRWREADIAKWLEQREAQRDRRSAA